MTQQLTYEEQNPGAEDELRPPVVIPPGPGHPMQYFGQPLWGPMPPMNGGQYMFVVPAQAPQLDAVPVSPPSSPSEPSQAGSAREKQGKTEDTRKPSATEGVWEEKYAGWGRYWKHSITGEERPKKPNV